MRFVILSLLNEYDDDDDEVVTVTDRGTDLNAEDCSRVSSLAADRRRAPASEQAAAAAAAAAKEAGHPRRWDDVRPVEQGVSEVAAVVVLLRPGEEAEHGADTATSTVVAAAAPGEVHQAGERTANTAKRRRTVRTCDSLVAHRRLDHPDCQTTCTPSA